VTSAITVFELLNGARQNKRGEKTRSLIEKIPCFSLDLGSARHTALFRQLLEAKGQLLAMVDLMIAGTAMAHGIPLLTRNQKHFARIADLRLVPSNEQAN
jgi:tRNA(fMet)-specific endonuclease VapC